MHSPSADNSQNITQRTLRSSAWLFGRRIATNLIRLGTIGILARQLSPSDFGIVALAQVVLQFALLTREVGIGTYVIHYQDQDFENRAQSAFWFNIVITLAQLALFWAVLPLIREIYTETDLGPILLALAIVFVVQQLGVVPEAIVKRSLRFQPLVIRDIFIDFGSALLSVILALRGWGLWSLVAPQIIFEPGRTIFSFLIAKWIPSLKLGFRDWISIGRYSFSLMGSNLLGLILNEADTLFIGRLLGTQSVGFYNLAWQLSNLIGRNVTGVVASVAMPALSLVSTNQSRLQAAYKRILRILSALTFPLLTGLFVLADELVFVIYGPDWKPAVLLVRILTLFTIVRSVTSPSGVIYNVVGRPDVGLKFNILFLPFYLLAIIGGGQWGLLGIATAVMAVRTVGALLAFYLSTRLINLSFWKGIAVMRFSGILAFVMGLTVLALNTFFLTLGGGVLLRLTLCVILGGLVYSLGLIIIENRTFPELVTFISTISPSLGKKLELLKAHKGI